MKRGAGPEGRGESSGKVIARQIPRVSHDEVMVPSLGLESLEPEGNFIQGLIP
jgi:hypothetical protein